MRKNILILGHNYATQFIDIYNQYTKLFDRDKYEVTVAFLTGKPNDAVRQRVVAENVIFFQFPSKKLRTLKLAAAKQLLKLCREKEFQIVICHRYKATYLLLWVAQFCNIPAIIFVMHELGTMTTISRKLAIACLARRNMLIAGVSNAVRDDIRKELWGIKADQVITLYNMIDVETTEQQLLSRKAARNALHLSPDDFVFGNIARLAKNKDQESLIQAFALIKPYCPNVKLIIIGDGPLEERLKQQVAAANLNDQIIFTGFVQQAYRYMRAFDCFVLSSIQEAFGRVLLEAMIARIPIIATAVHGIPEVLGDTDFLVKPKDPSAFAEAMKQVYLLSDENRYLCVENQYQRAIEHFSIPVFCEQFWQLPLVQTIKA